MKRWDEVRSELRSTPRSWLVTGAAGFIGSHLVEELLGLGQLVSGIDDFSTGSRANLEDVECRVGSDVWSSFRFVEGSIVDPVLCRECLKDGPLVLHQAALGSVPRSIAQPLASFEANVTGFVNLLDAAREVGCPRFVYASSSSVYGDHPDLPKRETHVGVPLSPYAATKRIDEIWADTVYKSYGFAATGLRYFNVFGPRQDRDGSYAAVIPKWIAALLRGDVPHIYGDGETSRDFCPVANVVQANVLAAMGPVNAGAHTDPAAGRSFNVALGARTSLAQLFQFLREGLAERGVDCGAVEAIHDDFRAGDVRHSLADLSDIEQILGYEPDVTFTDGIARLLDWTLEG